jgi:hypothetical protein
MKRARYGGTPVPMPDIPASTGGLGRFATQVRDALRVLRDRPVIVPTGAPAMNLHPWQAFSNGDDTVSVNDGSVIYFEGQGSGSVPNEPFDGSSVDYTRANVTITASGTLYAKLTLTTPDAIATDNTFYIATYGVVPSSVTVELDPTLSGGEMSIPIATVTLASGIATVTKQILHYNPIVDLTFAEGLTP